MFIRKLDSIFYPTLKNNWDDDLFRDKILENLTEEMTMLDVGAGSGKLPMMNFRGSCKQVIGIDPDEVVLTNPYLDQSYVTLGESIPFDPETFDIAISDNVWEHIEKPKEFLREIWRVLKPNGLYLVKTPNALHYVSIIAKFTPHWFHEKINSLRGRSQSDTFETYHKLNSKNAIFSSVLDTGYRVEFFRSYEGRPEYLRISALTYLLGIAYERIVNFFGFMETFRVIHIVVLRKTSAVS